MRMLRYLKDIYTMYVTHVTHFNYVHIKTGLLGCTCTTSNIRLFPGKGYLNATHINRILAFVIYVVPFNLFMLAGGL